MKIKTNRLKQTANDLSDAGIEFSIDDDNHIIIRDNTKVHSIFRFLGQYDSGIVIPNFYENYVELRFKTTKWIRFSKGTNHSFRAVIYIGEKPETLQIFDVLENEILSELKKVVEASYIDVKALDDDQNAKYLQSQKVRPV